MWSRRYFHFTNEIVSLSQVQGNTANKPHSFYSTDQEHLLPVTQVLLRVLQRNITNRELGKLGCKSVWFQKTENPRSTGCPSSESKFTPLPFCFLQALKGTDDAISHVSVIFIQSTKSNAKSLLETPSQTHPEIMFYQLSGYPTAQSSLHIKLTITCALCGQIFILTEILYTHKDTHRLFSGFCLAQNNQGHKLYAVIETATHQAGFVCPGALSCAV